MFGLAELFTGTTNTTGEDFPEGQQATRCINFATCENSATHWVKGQPICNKCNTYSGKVNGRPVFIISKR